MLFLGVCGFSSLIYEFCLNFLEEIFPLELFLIKCISDFFLSTVLFLGLFLCCLNNLCYLKGFFGESVSFIFSMEFDEKCLCLRFSFMITRGDFFPSVIDYFLKKFLFDLDPFKEFLEDSTLIFGVDFLISLSWGVKYLILSGQRLSKQLKSNFSSWINNSSLFFLEPSIKFKSSCYLFFGMLTNSSSDFYRFFGWQLIFLRNFVDPYAFGVDLRGRSFILGFKDCLMF